MSFLGNSQSLWSGLQLESELTRCPEIINCTRYRRVVVLECANSLKIAFGRQIPCWIGIDWLAVKTRTHGYWTFEKYDDFVLLRRGKAIENFSLGEWKIVPEGDDDTLSRESFSNIKAIPFDTALDIFLSRRFFAAKISTTDGLQSAVNQEHAKASQSILRLPTEILRQIMCQMRYQELNSFRGTCRRLREISRDRCFNHPLFRPSTPRTLTTDFVAKDVDLHPVLANMDPWYEGISQIRYWTNHGIWRCRNIQEASCWTQMATNPPLTTIKFQLGRGLLRTINAPGGVTVEVLVRELHRQLGLMQLGPFPTSMWSFRQDEGQITTSSNGQAFYHPWAGFPKKVRDPTDGHLILHATYHSIAFFK